MASREHAAQNTIRNALAGMLPLFRINTGRAWASNDIKKLPDGSILMRSPRPFDAGVPKGFSDTFGVLPVTITPEMVGQVIGQAVFGEIKSDVGSASDEQNNFLLAMKNAGARVGVWRTPEDAIKTIFGPSEA